MPAIAAGQPAWIPSGSSCGGASFGGEAALLLGSYFPDLMNGVIAEVPNSYVDASYAMPVALEPVRSGAAAHHAAGFGAPAVSVERALSFRWNASAARACRPAARRGHHREAGQAPVRLPVTTLRYPDGGHYLGSFLPYTSITAGALNYGGGSVAGIRAANVEVHTKVLALLAEP